MRRLRGARKWAALTVAAVAAAAYAATRSDGSPGYQESLTLPSLRIAAPGRIEGATETVKVASGVDGILWSVDVREGSRVEAGQRLATIDCRDLDQEINTVRAQLETVVQQRRGLLRGGRPDQRAEARAHLDAAMAASARAQADLARASDLWAEKVISREAYEHAVAANALAEATATAARQHVSVVDAEPMADELARADAEQQERAAQVLTLQARRAKCTIAAPMAGVVVRQHKYPGEAVSVADGAPIVSLADISRFRVRAELDEADVGKVRVGDPASVTVAALGERALKARVVEIGRLMGRKQVLSGNPAEKSDRDVLDVVAEITETSPAMVVGLRTTVVFSSARVTD